MRTGSILLAALAAALLWACSDDPGSPEQAAGTGESAREQVIATALADPAFIEACAGTPGCAEPPPYPEPSEVETIWRVLLVREASGAIRIGRIDSTPVPAGDGVPVGPLSGTHRLVGLDLDDQPIDGQLLSFPDVMRIEYGPADSSPGTPAGSGASQPLAELQHSEAVDISGQELSTIGFVRALPEIVAIEVQDESGATLARVSLPPPLSHSRLRWNALPVERAFAASNPRPVWPYEGNIPPYCAHVIILEGELDRELAQDIAFEDQVIELVAPGPNQRAVIFAALRQMTPLLCQSVRRIALGVVAAEAGILGAVRVVSTGDMMLINVAGYYSEATLAGSTFRCIQMLGTIIHEAAHSADTLLNVQGSSPGEFAGDWIMPARTMAAQTIDRVRVEKGLHKEWVRSHQSFQVLDWAQPHQPSAAAREAVNEWSPKQVAEAGFMSHYGTKNTQEDIAEMVEWASVTRKYLSRGWGPETSDDFACQEMRAYNTRDVPGRLAAVYTKLMFLKDLGLVHAEDLEFCMGADIGLPIDSGGFHFWHDGNLLRSFDRNLTAKIGTNDAGDWVFEMAAEGEASFAQEMYPGRFELRLGLEPAGVPKHLVSWPRGLYKLGLRGNNTVRMRLEGQPAGSFDVKDGFVLVAESSNDRIAGSIFFTVAMRFGAPLPVPQTWKPPLVVRFLIEH